MYSERYLLEGNKNVFKGRVIKTVRILRIVYNIYIHHT